MCCLWYVFVAVILFVLHECPVFPVQPFSQPFSVLFLCQRIYLHVSERFASEIVFVLWLFLVGS